VESILKNIRILKRHSALVIVLLLLTIIGVTAQTVAASPAHNATQKATFGCFALGRGFVIWDGIPEDPPTNIEPTLVGFASCSGSARVKETMIDDDLFYVADAPKSIQSSGFLAAGWTHGSDEYRVVIDFYSTKKTIGYFDPELDIFSVGIFPLPDPLTTKILLSYEGMLIEEKGGVNTRREISGWATIIVYTWIGFYRLYFVFELELEDGTVIPVTLGWITIDFYEIPRASIFYHNVDVGRD